MKIKSNERLDDLQFNNLFIIQDPNEYCFTSDAVALANFVKVSNNGNVVELCSGSGVIGILVNAKNHCREITMVEMQEVLADMSRRSIEYNNIANINVVNAKLQGIHKQIGAGIYDVVICNPPYFKKSEDNSLINEKESVAVARHEITVTLEEIIDESNKLLKYGGCLYICNKESRLVDMFVYMRKYGIEPKEMKILNSNKGDNVVLIKAKKGGKGGIKIIC